MLTGEAGLDSERKSSGVESEYQNEVICNGKWALLLPLWWCIEQRCNPGARLVLGLVCAKGNPQP
jgi:hypothetical protein